MYFENFPIIYYEFDIGGKLEIKAVTDITTNVRIRRSILENITLYDEYDIVDGETPEIISEKVYGSPLYHWVIMLCNQRYDYLEDFPLPIYEFEQFVKEKYGEDHVYDIHHYVDTNGHIVSSDHPGATSVSNYAYESTVNESKRRIKLISKGSLFNLLAQFKELV